MAIFTRCQPQFLRETIQEVPKVGGDMSPLSPRWLRPWIRVCVCVSQVIMRYMRCVTSDIAAPAEFGQAVHTETEDCSFLNIYSDEELRQLLELGIVPRHEFVQLRELAVDVRQQMPPP